MQTTDHIRPFFWLPDDLRKDAMAQAVEDVVHQCWMNLAKKKNGGYECFRTAESRPFIPAIQTNGLVRCANTDTSRPRSF